MTETIENLFIYLVFITDLTVLLLILVLCKVRDFKSGLFAIAIYCALDLNVNTLMEFFPFKGMNVLYPVFTVMEYILFSTFLLLHIKNKSFKKAFLFVSCFFITFLIVYYSSTRLRTIDSVPIGIETILILICSFYFLFEQLNDLENKFIYNRFSFWIVIGIMLYLAGSLFIYLFANQVDRDTLNKYWFLTNVFYVLKNFLFAVGILTYVKQLKNPRPEKLYPYLN